MYFLEKTNTAIYKEIEEVLANSQKRRLKVGKHAKLMFSNTQEKHYDS